MDAATAGIVGSISGAIIGALIAWLAAIFVLRKQEKYKARADFISAFIEIQRLLNIRHPNHSSEYRSTYSLLNLEKKRGQVFILDAISFFSTFEIVFASFLSFFILTLTRLQACDTPDSPIPKCSPISLSFSSVSR
jgi:hypothetical protein